MAADAMLAEGHDGRVLISCTFGTFVPVCGSRSRLRPGQRAIRPHG